MRKGLLIVAVCGALMLAPGLVTPAHASHSWLAIGTAFRIGPAFISVVLAPSGYDYPYFYRFDRPLYSRGGCGPGCFVEDDYYYYPSDCPLVTTYFDRYGYDPYQVYHRYAPRYDGRGYRGHDGYRSYGDYGGRGYDRYDRYDDHRGTYHNRGYDNDNRYDRDHDRRYDDHRGYRDDDRYRHDRRYDDHRDYRDDGRYGHDRRYDEHRDRRDDGRYGHDREDNRGRGYDRDSRHRGHR
jgi:hypothetical protein